MQDKVERYIAEKKAERARIEASRKREVLLKEGLSVPSETPGAPNTPIEVTDEEYEEILKYASPNTSDDGSGVAFLLKIIAVLDFIGAVILGIILLDEYYGFLVALLGCVAGLVPGILLLGFADLLSILHEIRAKLNEKL